MSPCPGWMMLPTTRPMASAKVDIVRKYARARPPALPTVAAFRTEPIPRTMVQKMTGEIIILMRSTNISPTGFHSLAASGATRPKMMPPITAMMTAMYSQWLRSFFGVEVEGAEGADASRASAGKFSGTQGSQV